MTHQRILGRDINQEMEKEYRSDDYHLDLIKVNDACIGLWKTMT